MKLEAESILVIAALSCWRALAAEPAPAKWGTATNNVRIALVAKAGSTEIRIKQPLTLSVRVQNLSTNEVIYVYRSFRPEHDPSCTFRVVSPSGKDLLPRGPQGYAGGGAHVAIAPNTTKDFDFAPTKLCRFADLGTYRIGAAKIIWRSSNSPPFIARSASLPITVIPGRWKEPPKTNAPLHW